MNNLVKNKKNLIKNYNNLMKKKKKLIKNKNNLVKNKKQKPLQAKSVLIPKKVRKLNFSVRKKKKIITTRSMEKVSL